jgi:trimeric autotransporter adhesin
MHTLIHLKKGTPVFLIALVLVCLRLSPSTQAVLPPPPPDGGYPNLNTAEGDNALFNLTSGIENTAVGYQALFNNTAGDFNTAIGVVALFSNTTGRDNTATGAFTLHDNTTGSENTGYGVEALANNTTGDQNTATGVNALLSNTTADNNTATGFQALFLNTTGTQNTATGAFALRSNTTANNNTADGFQALINNSTGKENTAVGESAFKTANANSNTGVGFQVAFHTTSGTRNTAVGHHALSNNSTGSSNIALGANAGANLTTGSNNIDIASIGVGGESNTTRIGTLQTRAFIKGISGTAVTGTAVVVNAAGQLGVAPSSAHFKHEIRPMGKESEAILGLKPVSFCYDQEIDQEGLPQFGLVAEEVEKMNPDLVVRDDAGRPYTVRYDQVNAMLLNEFLKAHRKMEQQEAAIARQEKQIEALVTMVKEQTAQIQKMNVEMEISKSGSHVVKTP